MDENAKFSVKTDTAMTLKYGQCQKEIKSNIQAFNIPDTEPTKHVFITSLNYKPVI